MNYAIIGCGLIGKKRLAGLPAARNSPWLRHESGARRRIGEARQTGRAVADFKPAVADPQVDAVIVATLTPRWLRFPPPPSARANMSSLKNRRAFREAD